MSVSSRTLHKEGAGREEDTSHKYTHRDLTCVRINKHKTVANAAITCIQYDTVVNITSYLCSVT